MDKANVWVKSCFNKKTFHSKELAEKAILLANKKWGVDLEYYLCPHCYNFHLTKQKKYEVK